MFERTRCNAVFAFMLGLLVFSLPIFIAAPSRAADASATTRAARLTFMQGTVTINQADNTASLPAQLNLPLLTGVQVATGQDGEAEVEFEDGSVVRLTPNSALSLDNLAVEPGGVFTTNLSLLHGLAYLELRATPQYLYTLNAGGDIVSPVENTTVRVNFDQAPATFAVFDGTAHVERQGSPDNAVSMGFQSDVRAGESLRADPSDPARYFLTPQIDQDTWDQWNEDLDQAAAAQSADSTAVRNNYAGAEGYGWSDLDADGSWYDVPGQGEVWQPQVAADDSGFDPYGNGAWVWYPGTGYVWASAYPWGWTPYRCGTWSYFSSFGWGWAPGAGCGGFGWGFAGGGYLVNVGTGPRGYKPIRVPAAPPGPHPVHPVVPVHTTTVVQPPVRATTVQPGPRQIAGVTATPIKPVASGVVSGSGAAGSSLRRDFPVDSATRTPVMGLASTSPTAVHTNQGLSAPGGRPATALPSPGVQPTASPYGGQTRPAAGVRSAPSSAPTPRPVQQSAPAPRSATPQPQPAPRTYSPPPPAPHPTYTPPAPSRPTYSPPPAPAPSHPTYSPPPAPAGHNPK
jgi:hypothetical protein